MPHKVEPLQIQGRLLPGTAAFDEARSRLIQTTGLSGGDKEVIVA